MALRIKSHWHDDDSERSPDQIGSALAFISWRIAKDKAINLHGQDFVYDSDQQRIDVIIEYLYFQLNIVDRILHEKIGLNDEDRQKLIIALAKHLAGHVQENSSDMFGPADYVAPFIEKMNERGREYSKFAYNDDGPSYPFMRYLGYEMQQIMGDSQENRWVIDQVMDKDGWDVDKELSRAVYNLFD